MRVRREFLCRVARGPECVRAVRVGKSVFGVCCGSVLRVSAWGSCTVTCRSVEASVPQGQTGVGEAAKARKRKWKRNPHVHQCMCVVSAKRGSADSGP